uniref:Cen12_4 n=1 Tax=Solanum lycopersicum TaxID=4081 RepID=Q5MAC3_SOLLC|nr:cen12_4 [Solanum lycopersicum]
MQVKRKRGKTRPKPKTAQNLSILPEPEPPLKGPRPVVLNMDCVALCEEDLVMVT